MMRMSYVSAEVGSNTTQQNTEIMEVVKVFISVCNPEAGAHADVQAMLLLLLSSHDLKQKKTAPQNESHKSGTLHVIIIPGVDLLYLLRRVDLNFPGSCSGE